MCKMVSRVYYQNNNNLIIKASIYPLTNMLSKGKNKNLAFNFKSCVSTLKYTANCLL